MKRILLASVLATSMLLTSCVASTAINADSNRYITPKTIYETDTTKVEKFHDGNIFLVLYKVDIDNNGNKTYTPVSISIK